MKELKNVRQSNIELLRIFSMLGVILLHFNNKGIGKALLYVEPESINYYILYFFEAVCIVAVNLFILITGYFLCNSHKRDFFKPTRLLIQVVVFAVGIYIAKIISSDEMFSIKSLIRCFVPNNYFVILYVALYFVSVYYNIIVKKLSKKQFRIMLAVLFIIFGVWNSAVDILQELSGHEWNGLSTVGLFGSQSGYTIVQFSLMYFIGAYIRKYGISLKSGVCYFLILINALIITIWMIINLETAWEYCNPIVIANAILIFNVFRNMNIGSHKFINIPAKSSFSVFLLHGEFLSFLSVSEIVVLNSLFMIIIMLVSLIVIYTLCFIIDILYNYSIGKVLDLLQSKIKLPFISLPEE